MSSVSHEDRSSSEDKTIVSDPVGVSSNDVTFEAVGDRIGRYAVLEELGRGGMGVVLRAYDPKLQREVALKFLHRRVLGNTTTERLIAEARAMAKLSHANVVAVHDVDVSDGEGRVILVMEYVAGTTLRRWEDDKHPWRDVIGTYLDAGRGLAAAHRAGVLHRDFKPSNVLVGRDGSVKVTDFGLAELDDGPESQETLRSTNSGTVAGTPLYMSPEQHRGQELTPAADQFSFCVALWKALCGQSPFSAGDIAAAKIRGPDKWTNVDVPRVVADALHRGLNRSPAARWPDMDALLGELDKALRPPRRRWVWGLGALASIGAAAWMVGPSEPPCTGAEQRLVGVWDDSRRDQAQSSFMDSQLDLAAEAWERVLPQIDEYRQTWIDTHAEACQATAVRGEQSPEMLDRRIACLEDARTSLQAASDLFVDADDEVIREAFALLDGLPDLDRCSDIPALEAGPDAPATKDAATVEEIRTARAAAFAAISARRLEEGEAHLERAQELVETIDYPPAELELSLTRARWLGEREKYAEREQELRNAVELATRSRSWNGLRYATRDLVTLITRQNTRFEEAEQLLSILRGLAQQPQDEVHWRMPEAFVRRRQGDYAAAEAHYRRVLELRGSYLPPDHRLVGDAHNNLGMAIHDQGRAREALTHHQEALRIRKQALGASHPDVAQSLNNLALILRDLGELEESLQMLRETLQVIEGAYPPGHSEISRKRQNLANGLSRMGRFEEALEVSSAALHAAERVMPAGHPDLFKMRANVAEMLVEVGRFDEAVVLQRAVLAGFIEIHGMKHPHVAVSQFNLARSALALGNPREAYDLADEACKALEGRQVPVSWRGEARFVRGRAGWELAETAQARAAALADVREAKRLFEDPETGRPDSAAETDAWLLKHAG